MILGVLLRVILAFCRRRGMPVPDLSRLRRRRPRFGVSEQLVDHVATQADEYLRRRQYDKRDQRGQADR